jgi:flagellar protein FliS
LAEKNPYNHYKETQIMTASPGKLIVLLYEGAVRFINAAINALDEKKLDVCNNSLIRTQDIITELALSINFEAGELASKMYSLYMFFNKQLLEANIKKDRALMVEVRDMIAEILESWRQVADRPVPGQKPGGGLNVSG